MENPTALPQIHILHYHGHGFVLGLLWHPLSSLAGYKREARQFGREHGLDMAAIRRTDFIIQAGFAARSTGAVKGMYSLASTLARQLGDSWIAAWRIAADEDRYGLVALFEGAVIPGSDRVGNAEDIQRKVAQLQGRSLHFAETFLPPEFQLGGRPLDIEALLEPRHLRREDRLRPLAFGLSPRERFKLAGLGTALVVGLLGWQQWHAYSTRQAQDADRVAEQRRLAELVALDAHPPTEQSIQALEHPWARQASVETFIDACHSAIDRLPLSLAGWLFTTAQCDGERASATFKRTGNSTAEAFISAANGHFDDSPAFFDEGNSAALKNALSLTPAGDEPLQNVNEALATMTSWLHGQNLEPTLKEIPVQIKKPKALPGQPEPPAPPPPDWKHYELKFSSALPPATVLHEVPGTGFRLRSITTHLHNHQLTWTVTGDVYAR